MDCEHLRENLFDLQADRLSPEMSLDAKTHIQCCPACKKIVDEFNAIVKLINKEKEREPDPLSGKRILQYINSKLEKRQTGRILAWLRVLTPLALAASILIGIFIGRFAAKQGIPSDDILTNQNQDIELIKSELYISDFIDEDKTLFLDQ